MGLSYYLGANTPEGFASCFSGMTDAVSRLYVIKGGPGCGKSTAMKRIADFCEAEGMETHRILCSSDQDSLDGVFFPQTDVMYVDGTAPHVVEPSCPGARDGILDFGAFWDEALLAAEREEIEAVCADVAACYRRAYAYLRALEAYTTLVDREALQSADTDKLRRRAERICRRWIPARKNAGRGRRIDVFLDALSPAGPVFLNGFSDYEICEMRDGHGLYPAVTEAVMRCALDCGYTVLAARDPMRPDGAPLHLVIPSLRFALLTSGNVFGCPDTGKRRIRLDKMTDADGPESLRSESRQGSECVRFLLEGAMTALGDAKRFHDRLEALYRPAVDFAGIDALTERHCDMLLRAFRRL